MTKIRVSIVNFLNNAPLVWDLMCAETLRVGQMNVEYQRINDFVMLPEMDISATHCLISFLPPTSVDLGACPRL